MKSEVYEVSGSFKGRTLLPMPSGVSDDVTPTGDILYKIESIVIKWTHQVRSVLDLKSGQPILDGKNPGPLVEIKFWEDQTQNLQCIFDQLCTPKVKRMAALLRPVFKLILSKLICWFQPLPDWLRGSISRCQFENPFKY